MPRLPVPAMLLVAGSLAFPHAALAQGTGDHETVEALVKQLDQDQAHRTVVAEALAQARGALERATRLRVAGDEAHARAADGLALEWAETARDAARAADATAKAAELRRKAVDAQAQLERSKALVEEAVASVGRLQARIAEAEAGPGRAAVEVHEGERAKKKGAEGRKTAGAKPAAKSRKAGRGGEP